MNANVALLQQLTSSLKGKSSLGKQVPTGEKFNQALKSIMKEAESSGLQFDLSSQSKEQVLIGNSQGNKLSLMTNELKELLSSLQSVMKTLPDEQLNLDASLLTAIQNLPEWNSLSGQEQKDLTKLFDAGSIKDLLQKESIGKGELLVLSSWVDQVKTNELNEEQLTRLKDLIEDLSKKFSEEMLVPINRTQQAQPVLASYTPTLSNEQMEQVRQKLEPILHKVSELMQQRQSSNQQTIQDPAWSKVMSQLQQVAEQLVRLDKSNQNGKPVIQQMLQNQNVDAESTKALKSFEQALQNLSKRMNMLHQNQYSQNASVTTKEFGKWFQKAWANLSDVKVEAKTDISRNTVNLVSNHDPMNMSKQEQFIIKLNTANQGEQSVSKQLVEEFQKVMNRSRFTMNKAGSQLSIKLNPGSLGDMMVRMTQQNGEMMVKIMVTTQAAKEMLEGNMNQLRHMFSPNQVQIEKQDMTVNSGQPFAFDKDDREHQEEQKQQQNHHSSLLEEEDDEETLSFRELLMNEKV